MKIRKKLIIGFSLILILFMSIIFLIYVSLYRYSSSYSELNEIYVPFTGAAIEISSYSKRAEGHLILYLILHNEVDREKFFNRIESLKDEISTVRPLATDQRDIETIDTIYSETENILKYGNELLVEYDKDGTSFDPKEHEELIRKFHDTTSSVREKGVELSSFKSYSVNNKAKNVESDTRNIENVLLIFSVFVMFLSLIISFSLSHSITKPIKNLTKNIEDISTGKLNIDIDPKLKESKDEVGDLARAFERTLVSLKLAMRKRNNESREKVMK